MASLSLLIIFAVALSQMDVVLCVQELDMPICTSRYDFESNLIKDMAKLDLEMTVLKQSYSNDVITLKSETKQATEKCETETVRLQEELGARLSIVQTNLQKELADLRAEAIRRPVAFLVKNVHDIEIIKANKVLQFTENVWNTNNDYDTTSGYFTAPYNGSYIFNLQLCIRTDKYVNVQIVAADVVIANIILHGTGVNYYSCDTVSGVGVLAQGDRAWARFGRSVDTGELLFHSDLDRWTAFMGALVN